MTRARPLENLHLAALVLTLAACHESPSEVAIQVPDELGADSLALACEADLTCPGGGRCDPLTLRCELCTTDADCAGGVCEPSARVCVQCAADADCAEGVCHPTRKLCVGCWQDSDCESGVCHPDLLTCVECIDDAQCAGGTCNTATFGCTGGCLRDAQCADNDPCTSDACVDGVCRYEELAACNCPVAPTCPAGSEPVDTNDDNCVDACACDGGTIIRPTGFCPCPEAPACPVGTQPVDGDLDGCADACACPSGAMIGADGTCPCPTVIGCEGGLVASDLDGDGCGDTCTKPCATDCDCEGQGLVATTPCALACAQCGPYLACEDGVCQGRCGVDDGACDCPPPPTCGALESAVDSDHDGCNDTCACLVPRDPTSPDKCGCPFAISCSPGAAPADSDGDGCADLCLCVDEQRLPRPDGTCCDPLACAAGERAIDKDLDGCPDTCVCGDGSTPGDALPACPCLVDSDCKGGTIAIDTDQDACADTCACPDGEVPGPNGCTACLSVCEGEPLPAYVVFVDTDQDGCYDLVDACPVGTFASHSQNAGCPDTCSPCAPGPGCPNAAVAVDSDADNCPDACVCADGQPAPEKGCDCGATIVCGELETPIDHDLDGCPDGCAVPCSNACDCDGAARTPSSAPACATDCADCRVASSCVEGFCAFTCAPPPLAVCAIEASDTGVCGCDDVSYASACEADKAGVTVKRDGTCETGGCLSNTDCTSGQICELPTGVCDTAITTPGAAPIAARGECQALPTACVGSDTPVCGCDGTTYPNDCERRKAGVARAKSGACE